jgi:hypothetical protein
LLLLLPTSFSSLKTKQKKNQPSTVQTLVALMQHEKEITALLAQFGGVG